MKSRQPTVRSVAPSDLYIKEKYMSGDRFPFIMGVVGLIDGLIGVALWLISAFFWIALIAVAVVAVVSLF
jgi:hypothetical protein